jgi:hypothetical protein
MLACRGDERVVRAAEGQKPRFNLSDTFAHDL